LIEVGSRQRLRTEGWLIRVRGKGAVHLGGSPTKLPDAAHGFAGVSTA
jgi:hypothetical protein